MEEVNGSIPLGSTTKHHSPDGVVFCFFAGLSEERSADSFRDEKYRVGFEPAKWTISGGGVKVSTIMFVRRMVGTIAALALLLASLAFVCTQMGTVMMDMGTMPTHQAMPDCMDGSLLCVGQHMQAFFQSIPASIPDQVIVLSLLSIVSLTLLFWDHQNESLFQFARDIQELLKRSRYRYRSPQLFVAFCRGIIHSKRYA